jgi:hypothetical protein
MTTKIFQEFFSENLAGFGWDISPSELPDARTYGEAMVHLGAWWDSIDPFNRDIFRACDFSQGLRDKGYFATFPALFRLLSGNRMGTFDAAVNDIIACGRRANFQVDEQSESISNVFEVVG